MRRFERRPATFAYAGAALSAAAVFAADALTGVGIAAWVLYFVPVAMLQLGWRPRAPLYAAAACTLLVAIGFYAAPRDVIRLDLVATNRAMGVVSLWVVAGLVSRSVRAKLLVAEQAWIRAGEARLAETVQGDHTVGELGEGVLSFLAGAVDAQAGAMYAREDDGRYRRAAAWAAAGAVETPAALDPRASLLGQAAAENRVLRLLEPPPGYLRVQSALGGAEPAEILVAPLAAEGEVLGALELALLRPAGQAEQDLLEATSRVVAVALRSARYRLQLQELVGRTRAQAEELQQQSEELRVSNEELQQQAQALEASRAKLAEQRDELEQKNERLSAQARELEAQRDELEMQRDELARSERELARASQYKSEFLANVSHELRTPLNSILILSKLLAEGAGGALTEEGTRFASTIQTSGNDLLALINDVLDLSKIEAGRLEAHPEHVPLAQLTGALARTFEPMARQKALAFERVVEPGAPEALDTDPQRLQQILANLLSNAFKFTERGEVRLRARGLPGDRVAFDVEDTGVGIPPDKQQLVFEAFQQADAGISRRFGGTGLGLSISRELARLLGGDLTVTSAPGAGSTFTLVIPVQLRPATAPAASPGPVSRATAPAGARTAAAGDGPSPSGRDVAAAARRPAAAAPPADGVPREARRLLIVEDDPSFAEALCAVAKRAGFACALAGTGDAALELVRREPPSAILLDLRLPDHPGLAVLEQLKRLPATRHIPVHVVSAAQEEQAARSLGAIGFALKPAAPDRLEQVFREIEAQLTRQLRRVLLVEDDVVQRDAVTRLLGGPGTDIVPAHTVAEALARLEAETFDCMVLDLVLPDGSGYDLLDRMAAEERYAFPPVIVYTGRALSRDEEERLRRYSSSIIVKGARSPERLLDEVSLFLHRVEADLPGDRRRMLQAARSRDAALEGRRILLVEDDARNVFALASALEPRGATLEVARNGREALEQLRAGPPPDLVLMDIMMPEMDGYEALRRIRAEKRFEKLPMIALTARAMRDDQERCLAAGANDYLPKPVDVEKLVSLIHVWLPR